MLPILPIKTKNASNKTCSESNFLQKSQFTHVSISLEVELGGSLQFQYIRLPSLEPLAPMLGEIDIYAQWLFNGKFNDEQLLFEIFVIIIGNSGSVQP